MPCEECPLAGKQEPCECEARPDHLHAVHVLAWLIGYAVRLAWRFALWLLLFVTRVFVAFWVGAALLLWGLIGGRTEK